MPTYVDRNLCTRCASCVEVCARGAISLSDSVAVIDASLCTECGRCAEVCPAGAILAVEVSPVSEHASQTPHPSIRHAANNPVPAQSITTAKLPAQQADLASPSPPTLPATRGELVQKALQGVLAFAAWVFDRTSGSRSGCSGRGTGLLGRGEGRHRRESFERGSRARHRHGKKHRQHNLKGRIR